ncbi:hypothetical protein GQ53DRAFT_753249 [Thozetella sp. PMI_491]|nr:hypothetical protein GQ53DRAFT_753249 [Thozetella sp. PMI_491]
MSVPSSPLPRRRVRLSSTAVQLRDYPFSTPDSSSNDLNFSPFQPKDSSSGSHLSTAAIAGIVVGCLIFVGVIAGIFYVLRRRNRQLKEMYAYGVKDTLPQGASLDNSSRSSTEPAEPAGPPPPYQPPEYPPAATIRRQQSYRQSHVYGFQSTQHQIDANRAQTMDGSYRYSGISHASARHSVAKSPTLSTRSELEGEPSSAALRRQAA